MMEAPPQAPCWSSIVQKQAPPKPQPQPQPSMNSRVFESCKSKQGIAVAIVDANAIIQGGERLVHIADKVVSVPEVLEEVRDPVSRLRLEAMPFTVDTMEPDPDALKMVVSFARATGDLQTLSDVDLKLIALTYTWEAQVHGTKHLKENPPPLHVVNVKRLPEKEMPGWGSNVPNLEEWEALEHADETGSNLDSRILPLKDLNTDTVPANDHTGSENILAESRDTTRTDQENVNNVSGGFRRFMPRKKNINIEGKMVASGIDASLGEDTNDVSDWRPAVSRSTHRRYLRRKERQELSLSSEKIDDPDDEGNEENIDTEKSLLDINSEPIQTLDENLKEQPMIVNSVAEQHNRSESDASMFLSDETALDTSVIGAETEEPVFEPCLDKQNTTIQSVEVDTLSTDLDNLEILSQADENDGTLAVDDASSEQSRMLQSLSESSIACVTGDFAMQNVILQMGLRLLAPDGMQIRQLHRWILKCHACNKVTAEIGRIFCPKCGNGGTLRKVSATVGEDGIVLAARRPRVTLRGTKFSLPLPQGGRDAITKNLILREDQLPHKILYPKKKNPNKQDLDLFRSDDIFSQSANKKAPLKPPVGKALHLFSGRRNPNDNHFSRSNN